MIKSFTVHANCDGSVHTLTVQAKSAADAVAEVRFLFALSGRVATVFAGF